VKIAVGADRLNDAELRSFMAAIDAYRGSTDAPGNFHSAPIRGDGGKLCEVRFYSDSDGASDRMATRARWSCHESRHLRPLQH
jgi:hypothetical protein